MIERRADHRLAVLRHVDEVSGNVAVTCRYRGISRQAYYAWKRRCGAEGFEGLKGRGECTQLEAATARGHVEVDGMPDHRRLGRRSRFGLICDDGVASDEAGEAVVTVTGVDKL